MGDAVAWKSKPICMGRTIYLRDVAVASAGTTMFPVVRLMLEQDSQDGWCWLFGFHEGKYDDDNAWLHMELSGPTDEDGKSMCFETRAEAEKDMAQALLAFGKALARASGLLGGGSVEG